MQSPCRVVRNATSHARAEANLALSMHPACLSGPPMITQLDGSIETMSSPSPQATHFREKMICNVVLQLTETRYLSAVTLYKSKASSK
jgi:hypothetical protein